MSVFKQFWQNLLQRFRPRIPWSVAEIERELSGARQEREQLLSQLTDLRSEVGRGVSANRQEQEKLLNQLQALHVEVEEDLASANLERQALRRELGGFRSEVEHGLEAAHRQQQSLFGQLNGLQLELEHRLAAVREEQQGLGGRMDGLRSEVEHGLAIAREEHQDMLGQIGALRSELEHGLESLRQEQQGLQERLDATQADVERSFVRAREERQSLRGELGKLQGELGDVKSREEILRVDLEQRFEQIQVERDAANQVIAALRTLLADVGVRQEVADSRLDSLEMQLKEQRRELDVALQQTLVQERRTGRRLTLATTVAAAAFVLGIVGSTISFWEVHNTTRLLAEVSQEILGIQSIIAGQSSADVHGPSPHSALVVPENIDTPHVPNLSPADTASTPPKREHSGPGSVGPRLPDPDFIASKSLPAGNYRFKRREDASAFLRENAKQPGVVTLPSGLQYRELIPGTGKKPGTHDKVVIEYRAFRPDGTETDNSFKKDVPKTLVVNEAFLGLKEALLHMQEGAQWELYIPAKLAYRNVRKRGRHGYEPRILIVELVSVASANDSSQP